MTSFHSAIYLLSGPWQIHYYNDVLNMDSEWRENGEIFLFVAGGTFLHTQPQTKLQHSVDSQTSAWGEVSQSSKEWCHSFRPHQITLISHFPFFLIAKDTWLMTSFPFLLHPTSCPFSFLLPLNTTINPQTPLSTAISSRPGVFLQLQIIIWGY